MNVNHHRIKSLALREKTIIQTVSIIARAAISGFLVEIDQRLVPRIDLSLTFLRELHDLIAQGDSDPDSKFSLLVIVYLIICLSLNHCSKVVNRHSRTEIVGKYMTHTVR